MNILVCGDSFSYGTKGWVQHIKGNVTNKSENGVGQYKILKQTVGHEKFDKILICHTSPWRIHTSNHPLHKDNKERPNNDFMLADLDHNQHVLPQISEIYSHIKKYTDWDYVQFVYELIVDKLLEIPNSVHITFHQPVDTKKIANNYYDVWQKHKGNINHLDQIGNEIIAKRIQTVL